MQKILEEIKAVRGIIGVLIWDKSTLSSYQLLPASFATNTISFICSKMIKLSQGLSARAKLQLFYDNGAAIIVNRPRALVLILGRINVDFALLDLVLNSALSRLDKIHSFKEVEKLNFPPLKQVKMDYLIEGMNLLSHYVYDKIGTYRTTQYLRQAKDKLISSYPFMAYLFVDNNARISLIKGKGGVWSGEVILAFAKWAAYMEKLSFKKGKGFNLKKVTSPLEEKLEEMGFYFAFQCIKENI